MRKLNKKFIFTIFVLLSVLFCAGLYFKFEVKNDNYKCPDCNVIYISIDALRADHLGCYGYQRNTSPNIDKLAQEGILFSQAISQSTETIPSIPSIMTSLYPSVHNISEEGMTDAINLVYRGISTTTLAEVLGGAGYSTTGFSYGPAGKPFGVDQGFKDFRTVDTTYDNEELKSQLFSWLEDNHNKKFFLFFHTLSVHEPYILPSPYDKMYDPDYKGKIKSSKEYFLTHPDYSKKGIDGLFLQNVDKFKQEDIFHLIALYDGRITYTDEFIGRLLDKLKEFNLFKNTIIILAADHGEEFFEHGNFGHGHSLYDEVLHIPLIIKIPNMKPKIINQQVRAIDIMPTILDVLDIDNQPATKQMQGGTLIPAVYGKNLNLTAFSELSPRQSVRTKEWKYIVAATKEGIKEELYNLNKDSGEQKNLINDFPKILEKLKREMAEWQKTNKELSQKYAFSKEEGLTKEEIEFLIDMFKNLGYIEPTEIQKPDL